MNEQQLKEMAQNAGKSVFKLGKVGLGVAAAVIVGYSSFGYNDSGVSTRLQQPLIGHTWIKEEGYYFKLPFVSRTRSYNQKGTIASSDNQSILDTASLVAAPRNLQFADSYEMRMEWSFRYEIPVSDEGLEAMHKSVKSEANLLGNTIMPFGQTLAADTAGQMLAGNFSQGGRNEYRSLMDNQSQLGMYETKVTKVQVNAERADADNKRNGDTKQGKQFIRKVTYLLDDQGKRLRKPLAIHQYGVKVVPNSINLIEAVPQGRLVTYIDNKQSNISKQIKEEENQKLLREQAKTAQLKGQHNLITRTNELNIKKQEAILVAERKVEEAQLQAAREKVERQKVSDLAVIDKNRELEVAQANEAIETVERQKAANLAVIDKNRELQIAKANEGIQKATAIAAKYQADAIKEVGFAEAAVDKAKLAAKNSNKEIYLAELNRDVQVKMAEVLPQVKIDTPDIVMGGSNGSNNVSDLLSTKLVQDVINNNRVNK